MPNAKVTFNIEALQKIAANAPSVAYSYAKQHLVSRGPVGEALERAVELGYRMGAADVIAELRKQNAIS